MYNNWEYRMEMNNRWGQIEASGLPPTVLFGTRGQWNRDTEKKRDPEHKWASEAQKQDFLDNY